MEGKEAYSKLYIKKGSLVNRSLRKDYKLKNLMECILEGNRGEGGLRVRRIDYVKRGRSSAKDREE